MAREKILLDTDIGSDIDDAVCLAYLLAQPACELLGITTVSGQPVERARLASALCRAAGANVPILPGAPAPLLGPVRQARAPQAAALDRWPHDTDFPPGRAVSFLAETIRQHPGQVSLLAIGPMTNLGLLFRSDPEVAGLLRRLVLMCGVFTDSPQARRAEWNALNDPVATAIVYATPVAAHRSVGLDVTRQVRMDADEVRRRFTGDLLSMVRDFAEVWFAERDVITFHDPLTAVTLFDAETCHFESGYVEVDIHSPDAAGRTLWTPQAEGPHQVAFGVDSERFFQRYFEVF